MKIILERLAMHGAMRYKFIDRSILSYILMIITNNDLVRLNRHGNQTH